MPLEDLTHPIEHGMQTYPGDPAVSLGSAETMAEDGARVTTLALGSHSGTHVDAPAHTEPDGASLGTFAVSDFRFEARLVDVTGLDDRAAIAPDVLPTDAELESDVDCLVFHTGWDAHWDTDRYRDHPALAPATSEWCAERGLAVGIDAFSPDPTPSATVQTDDSATDVREATDARDKAETPPADFPAHHALLGSDCLIIENLTSLDALPARFTLHAYPLALDGDGAPVRAVAEF